MAFRNVVVGVLQADTYGLLDGDRTTVVREAAVALRAFRGQRIAARPASDARWSSPDSRPSMILAGPEYMLAKQGVPPDDDRLRDLNEKQTIEREMALLSSTAGAGLVLAPGSIAYAQNFTNTPQAIKEAQICLGMGAKASKLANDDVVARLRAMGTPRALAVADKVEKENPQKSSLAGDKTPSTKEKRTAINSRTVQFIAKNETALYHRGKEIARYAKVCDFNEVSMNRANTVFIPGAKIGRATVGGIAWGIEICFDHNIGVLSNTAADTAPRVHLLCSAWVSRNEAKSVVQPGGYVVHSSSEEAECGVWRRNQGGPGFTAVAQLARQAVHGGLGQLLCYEIELDLP